MANVTINSLPTASTIDATNDLLPIYTNSLAATQAISRNTYLNLSSQPVGLTDSQTLTNKTLTSPTINGATLSGTLAGTYTIGGTPTFPATVVQTTTSQTLTNKTLTSPTITSPTITNATISADTLTGYTVSNTGTVYGVPVTTGAINASYLTASSITNTQIASAGLYTTKVYNPYKFSVYRSAAYNTVNAAGTVFPFDTKLFDTGTNVDVVTNKGRFTAPIAGFYFFSGGVYLSSSTAASSYTVYIYKNGAIVKCGELHAPDTVAGLLFLGNAFLQLAANDYVELAYYAHGEAANTGATGSFFEGFLVSAT